MSLSHDRRASQPLRIMKGCQAGDFTVRPGRQSGVPSVARRRAHQRHCRLLIALPLGIVLPASFCLPPGVLMMSRRE